MIVAGLDFGGVIVAKQRGARRDTFFTPEYLDSPAVPGALAGLKRLIASPRYAEVLIISKAGSETARRSVEWLGHNFLRPEGLAPDAVRWIFTTTREEKAAVAPAGLAFYVDDHLEPLQALRRAGVPGLFLLDPARRFRGLPSGIARVDSWTEILEAVL